MTRPTNGGRRHLRVEELRREAEGILSLRLTDPAGATLPAWAPGSHIDLRLPSGIERQYSLCSDPADRVGWRIAVLREDNGRGGSREVHGTVRPGDLVEVSDPIDTFSFQPGQETVFVAGGVGITPILPMVRAVRASGLPWRLLYLGRSRETMAYVNDPLLAHPRVDVFAADEGRRADLRTELGTLAPGTAVFACGPARLLDAMEDVATDWPARTLRVERFHAKPLAAPVSTDAFEVDARRSGLTVTVEPGCSILDTLERAGISVPNSCREGVCGTCETTIVDGAADHRDSILSPEEREENETMMICVSRSIESRLVLDI
ncbi:PDR/VanB family oxidoreductase [Leifsonia poae]|uniref:PDR/VanB family oxidoreductase n=1 Tax=Leifsonia poae TaxID=110933 RepID=UPI001CBEF834|nr:PDR/VanB family oxidoreductase [Leifsonia poae]